MTKFYPPFELCKVKISKADIRNPLSLLAHERSRFAYVSGSF